MKIKSGFILREVAGSFVVVAVGSASKNFKGVIKLNESGSILWKELEKGNDDVEKLADVLVREYSIDKEMATNDVLAFLTKLKEAKIVE